MNTKFMTLEEINHLGKNLTGQNPHKIAELCDQAKRAVQLEADCDKWKQRAERYEKDYERINWIESHGDGSGWIARESTTGRGFRVHNSNQSHNSLREAIDTAQHDARTALAQKDK